MNSWRVGLVCGYFDPTHDGVADYTRHLQRALRRTGVDALICTTDAYAQQGQGSLRSNGREVIVGVTHRFDFSGIREAARNLRRLKLDVVHVQYAPSAFWFSRAVGLLPVLLNSGVPLVVTLHEYGVWVAPDLMKGPVSAASSVVERSGLVDRETLFLVPRADRVLVVSEEHVQVLSHRFIRWRVRPTVVPVGPNILMTTSEQEDPRRNAREALGIPDDTPVIVFFGFFHPVKALDRLIEAVALVRPSFPGVRLVLAGGEESHSVMGQAAVRMRHQLEDVARRLHVDDAVTFTGYLPEEDVSRLLLAADVAVFPFDEGVTSKSGSLLAARVHGVPIIATAAPGILTARKEMDGILSIPPRDTAAIAEALKLVLGDPGVTARLREANHAYSAAATWEAIAQVHLDTYTDVIRGHGGSLG